MLGMTPALVRGKCNLSDQAGTLAGVFTLVFRHFAEGCAIIHDPH